MTGQHNTWHPQQHLQASSTGHLMATQQREQRLGLNTRAIIKAAAADSIGVQMLTTLL